MYFIWTFDQSKTVQNFEVKDNTVKIFDVFLEIKI